MSLVCKARQAVSSFCSCLRVWIEATERTVMFERNPSPNVLVEAGFPRLLPRLLPSLPSASYCEVGKAKSVSVRFSGVCHAKQKIGAGCLCATI
jgi:hypothetical protein